MHFLVIHFHNRFFSNKSSVYRVVHIIRRYFRAESCLLVPWKINATEATYLVSSLHDNMGVNETVKNYEDMFVICHTTTEPSSSY